MVIRAIEICIFILWSEAIITIDEVFIESGGTFHLERDRSWGTGGCGGV